MRNTLREKCRPAAIRVLKSKILRTEPENGQAIVEFAIAFPVQLLIMLSIMQLALIYVGNQVVTYSAYQAARSASVAGTYAEAEERAHRAAAMICSPITGPTITGSNLSAGDVRSATIEIPGWGELPGSGVSSRLKTHVSELNYIDPNKVEATVTHYYELTLPVVGFLFGSIIGHSGRHAQEDYAIGPDGTMRFGSDAEHESRVGIWNINAPHMRIRSTARIASPGGIEY